MFLVTTPLHANQNDGEMVVRFSAPAHDYITELVVLALDKSGLKYRGETTNNVTSQTRAVRLLGDENGIDLSWHVTSKQLEQQAHAVLIPLDKGLLGYRIALVAEKNRAIFQNVRSQFDLERFNFGLGFDWADLAIFRSNNLITTEISDETKQQDMLRLGRFDALPLSILEMDESSLLPGLIYEPNLVIQYPAATYFFVAKNNDVLHHALTLGLTLAQQDGSWQQLFDKHFKSLLKKANLSQRKVIRLKNHLLPASAPLEQKQYWYPSS
jgi:hypothetical protein